MHVPVYDRADALLQGLVERYSPSMQERPAVSFLVKEMSSLGARSYIDRAGNAVGEWGQGDKELLLLGHIDTVPGFIAVRRVGQRLYGRGTVDAKGPLVAFVVAASCTPAAEGHKVTVVGAVEEEAATSKGARALLGNRSPAAVVIGEPSGWDRITVGYKGRLLVDYALSQKVGHTAGPDTTVCEQAVALWQVVAEDAAAFNPEHTRMIERLAPSLRKIESTSDGFVETVSMTIGYRLPLGYDVDGLKARVTEWAGDASVQFRGYEKAYRASRASALARAFVRAIRAAGAQPGFKVKSGTSDMNVVGPVWKCPIVAYGPGDSRLDHTPHEHIDLGDYHRAIDVLRRVIGTF